MHPISVDDLTDVIGGQAGVPAFPPPTTSSVEGAALAAGAQRRAAAVTECAAILDKTGVGTRDSHIARCDQMANELGWVDRRAF